MPTAKKSKVSSAKSKPSQAVKAKASARSIKKAAPKAKAIGRIVKLGVPVAKPAVPVAKPVAPPAKLVAPPAKPAAPPAKPAAPPAKPVAPPAKPAAPVTSVTKPTESVTKPTESVTKPTESVTKPTESVTKPIESVAEPVAVTAAPAQPVPLKPLAIRVPLTVKELADKLSVSPSEIIKRLLGMGILATINQMLTEETVKNILPKYGYEYQRTPTLEEQLEAIHEEEDKSKLVHRPPIVTMMGHVDHGKTSLLDAIRKSRVVEREAGGITQHLGAYQVNLPKGTITFLDTPGHEAFTAMRSRGAHVTDIVILVVAADDGVMPQTQEAIDHAKAADATIVVALNKIDKPGANPDRVKQQLMQLGLTPEDWGGKTVVVPVSAKTGEGIDKLLEMMLLEAELLELKADPTKPAKGYVLEAELSKGKGPTARILVQNGTLHVGDVVVSGTYSGKVRAMLNDHGQRLEKAGPSYPAEILGLNGVPKAGDPFFVVPDERQAREVVMRRQETLQGDQPSAVRRAVTLEEFHQQLAAGRLKGLNLILKADVQGSVEALRDSLVKLSSGEAGLKFLHVGVGDVTEPDVLLAEASNAVVIAFHVGMTPEAEVRSKEEGVDVRLYQVIYEAVADIRAALEGLLEPRLLEQVLGQAKVLQVFKVSKVGTVAGCQVLKGKFVRGLVGRVLRGKEKIFQGKITSLKRFKEDVREVTSGMECGVALGGFNDFQPEDLVEAVEVTQVAQRL